MSKAYFFLYYCQEHKQHDPVIRQSSNLGICTQHFYFNVIQNCRPSAQETNPSHSNRFLILSDTISAFCLLKILVKPKPRFIMCFPPLFSPLYLQYKYSHPFFLHHIENKNEKRIKEEKHWGSQANYLKNKGIITKRCV